VHTSKGKRKRTVIPDTENEGSEPDSEPAAESAEAELSILLKLSPKPGTHTSSGQIDASLTIS